MTSGYQALVPGSLPAHLQHDSKASRQTVAGCIRSQLTDIYKAANEANSQEGGRKPSGRGDPACGEHVDCGVDQASPPRATGIVAELLRGAVCAPGATLARGERLR
jgi:hypothetical protein